MNFSVNATPKFEKEIKRLSKKYPSLKTEYVDLVLSLRIDPLQGIPLGNRCYKIKLSIASKGKGKSGGARVITYVQVLETKVFLLTIFDKSERENISERDLSALLKGIP